MPAGGGAIPRRCRPAPGCRALADAIGRSAAREDSGGKLMYDVADDHRPASSPATHCGLVD